MGSSALLRVEQCCSLVSQRVYDTWMVAGWALCGHDPQELPRLLQEEAMAREAGSKGPSGPNPGVAAEGISLRDRVIVGSQCKRLIEYGRLKWLQSQGECFVSEVVQYVDPAFSGENRLLVVKFK
jgi:Methyltransferase TRM13